MERDVETITKDELARRVAEELGVGQRLAGSVIRKLLEDISRELEWGNRVEFRHFGVFEIVHRAPRKARNPQSGATLDVPATERIKFKPAKRLRELAERRLEG